MINVYVICIPKYGDAKRYIFIFILGDFLDKAVRYIIQK